VDRRHPPMIRLSRSLSGVGLARSELTSTAARAKPSGDEVVRRQGSKGAPVTLRSQAQDGRQLWAGPKNRSIIPPQPGEVSVSSSCETAATYCAGTNGFSIRTLAATPCDLHSRALAPVM
jgi:hypothetical protein